MDRLGSRNLIAAGTKAAHDQCIVLRTTKHRQSPLNFEYMTTLLIQPKSQQELKLVQALLEKMNIKSVTLSTDEKEEVGLLMLMKQANKTKMVSRKTVMRKLLNAAS
jgi:hypothetical protein